MAIRNKRLESMKIWKLDPSLVPVFIPQRRPPNCTGRMIILTLDQSSDKMLLEESCC
jgi:hypothetical protein